MTKQGIAASVARGSWLILGLTFLAGLLNYIDRQTLAILKATLKEAFSLSDTQYGHLVTAFMVPYIVFYVVGGRLVDKLGTRWGMTIFIGFWSLANTATGLAANLTQMMGARAMLGASEPGYFPAMLRVVMNWFPREKRAFALSLLTTVSTTAAIVSPALVAWITHTLGWRYAFIIPGVIGLLLALVWWFSDRNPPFAQTEVSQGREKPTAFRELLRDRRVWGLIAVRMITDPVFYFQLFWLPGYMQEKLGLSLSQLGAVGWIPSLVASVTIIVMGRWSDSRVASGAAIIPTRMKLFVWSSFLAPVGALTTFAPNIAAAFVVLTIVTVVAQMWFFSYGVIVSELFPKGAGSVTGLIGACGATGGLIMNTISGPLIESAGYAAVFIALAFLHPIGAIILRRTIKAT
jgi:ACS family hexuronate transporter-like MFS transporter